MATLHKEFIEFNGRIELTKKRKKELIKSRDALKDKIKKYFKEAKPNELKPKFTPQGSFDLGVVINPIPEYDDDENIIRKYDLDYGIYFIEKDGQSNKKKIQTWHDWVFNAVEGHTKIKPKQKATCVRVIFSDGHHIDLPIYYNNNGNINLAHKSKGWIKSNPDKFSEWFRNKANGQLKRIIRYVKAWKNFNEYKNTNLKFPSGFALTILTTNNYVEDEFDDIAFRKTLKKIKSTLDNEFKCLRPTTPKGENLFEDYSETRKNDFLNALAKLIDACYKAKDEDNFKKASEHIQKRFGDRFPNGKDETSKDKSNRKSALIGKPLAAKPYAE